MPKVAKVARIIYIYWLQLEKSEGKLLSGLYVRLYLISWNNLQGKEERVEVRMSARIVNAGVV